MLSTGSKQRQIFASLALSLLLGAWALPAFAEAEAASIVSSAASDRDGAAASGSTSLSGELNLKGLISVYQGPSPDQLVGGLVNAAIQKADSELNLDKKNKQMSGIMHKAINGAKMSAHFVIEYRGFEMSSEGADIILGEKLKLKSQSATEYASQKRADELHAKVFSSLLQMGQGLGMEDPVQKDKTIEAGYEPLKQIVGKDAADEALNSLKAWSNQLSVPSSVFQQSPWTVMELQGKTEELLRESAQSDPVMSLVRRALHKYNGHSKFSLGAAKVINTSLNLAMLSPTVVAPIANILQFVYQMSTGGPEDSKLLAELYLDKRLESRWKRLNQEAGQAVNAYNNAVMTRNPVLLGLSESFISALGGEDTSGKIVGARRQIARKSTHDDAIDCVQTHTAM